jgi:serine/threonine-protein kinase
MILTPGTSISGYRIERKLGSGAFGTVWLAAREDSGEKVAIKTLTRQAPTAHFDHVSRFKREANNLRRINSEYVARCIDFIVDDDQGMFLVMEYIDGELLSDILMETPLSLTEAVELGVHLGRGLCDMHKVGVIHRDLKPSNIMIRALENGLQRAVIFDLGLSRFVAQAGEELPSGDVTGTASRVAIGTPAFMAPEQMLDARRATAPSDVYGIGVVLYYASSGRLPFQGDDRDIARMKLSEEAPPLELGRGDELALRFADVVAQAIRRRPDDRFRTAEDFLAALVDLRQLAMEVDVRRARGSTAPPPPPPPAPRPRQLTMPDTRRRTEQKSNASAIALAALLFLGVVIGGLWFAGVFTSP